MEELTNPGEVDYPTQYQRKSKGSAKFQNYIKKNEWRGTLRQEEIKRENREKKERRTNREKREKKERREKREKRE